MDRMDSWKRTDDIEIDLKDLLCRLCRQWKQIAACAVLCAVILGGYGWKKSEQEAFIDVSDMEIEETVLTEEELQEVESAVCLKNEIRGLETYLRDSVLMQLDAYHKNKVVMLFCIDCVKRQELPAVTESYLNYVLNGGAADALLNSGKSWNMDKSCLAELVTAYQRTYNLPYQIAVDDIDSRDILSETLFYVEVTGMNVKNARKMAQDIQNALEKYSSKVKKAAGSHRLRMVNKTESITADSGLQIQQHDKKTLLLSNRTNLKTMTDAFRAEQMAFYQNAAGVEKEDDQKKTEPEVSDKNYRSFIKYLILGILGGFFVYCGLFFCWYILRDTVKSMEEMRRRYLFPVYGPVLFKNRNVKKAGAFETEQVQLLNRMKLICHKHKITKLCAVSDFLLDTQEKEYLECIAQQLKNLEIEMSVIEKPGMDKKAWDSLAETANVLLVCKADKTTYRVIDDTMNFYQENSIHVTGAVVFS